MREHRATRTLVKSAPELWLTCSEESLLARHLEPFGEIRVTRLEPESTVAWEGEAASGTVQIEPSGWGTRVTLTASIDEADDEEPQDEAPDPGAGAIEDGQSTAVEDAPEVLPAAVEDAPEVLPAAVEAALEANAAGVEAAPEVPPTAMEAAPEPVPARAAPSEPPVAPSGIGEFWARMLNHLRRRPAVRPSAVAQPASSAPPAHGVAQAPALIEELQPTAPESDPEELASAAADPEAEDLQPAVADPGERHPAAADPEAGEPHSAAAEPDAGELQPTPAAFDADAALLAALDSLGRAHHRPFSR
jgi:hypothetical protein